MPPSEDFNKWLKSFTPRAKHVLLLAQKEAQKLNCDSIGAPHLFLGIGHKGVLEGGLHTEKIDMALVMGPFHSRDHGKPREYRKMEVLAVVVVIRHGDEIQAQFFRPLG